MRDYISSKEGSASGEGWTKSLEKNDGISHSLTSLGIWAFGCVKGCMQSWGKKESRDCTWHRLNICYQEFLGVKETGEGEPCLEAIDLLTPPRHGKLQSVCIPQQRSTIAFSQCGNCDFWIKSEKRMGERKRKMATSTLLYQSSELVTQGHPGRNLYSATKKSHVSRGRKWKYSSSANMGSPSAPSAPKSPVKTWYRKSCPSVTSNPKPYK